MKAMSYKRTARWMRKRKIRQKRLNRLRHEARYASRSHYGYRR